MPRVPIAEESVQRTALPGARARSSATPGLIGGGTRIDTSGLGKLGDTLLEINERAERLKSLNQFQEGLVGFRERIGELDTVIDNPDVAGDFFTGGKRKLGFRDVPGLVEKDLRETADRLAAKIEDQRTRTEFMLRVRSASVGVNMRARAAAAGREKDQSLALGLRMQDNALESFARDPVLFRNPDQRSTSINNVIGYYNTLRGQGAINSVEFEKLKKAFTDRVTVLEFNQDYQAAVNDGTGAALGRLIRGTQEGLYPGIKPEDRPVKIRAALDDYIALREKIEKEAEKELKASQAQTFAALMTDPEHLALGGQDLIQRLVANQSIDETQATQMQAHLRLLQKEAVDDDTDPDALADVMGMITGGEYTPDEIREEIFRLRGEPGNLNVNDFASLLTKVRTLEKELETEEGQRLNRDIKDLNQRIQTAVRTTGVLADVIPGEEILIADLRSIAEARLRNGETVPQIWSDLFPRIDKHRNRLVFSEEAVREARNTLATADPASDEYDLAAKRLLLFNRQAREDAVTLRRTKAAAAKKREEELQAIEAQRIEEENSVFNRVKRFFSGAVDKTQEASGSPETPEPVQSSPERVRLDPGERETRSAAGEPVAPGRVESLRNDPVKKKGSSFSRDIADLSDEQLSIAWEDAVDSGDDKRLLAIETELRRRGLPFG